MDEVRLDTFITSVSEEFDEDILELERNAIEDNIPIIRKDMQNLLRMMLGIVRPEKILEIGTAVGFSAILMKRYNPQDCHITTIENYKKRILAAKENFKKFGMEDKVLEFDVSSATVELAAVAVGTVIAIIIKRKK